MKEWMFSDVYWLSRILPLCKLKRGKMEVWFQESLIKKKHSSTFHKRKKKWQIDHLQEKLDSVLFLLFPIEEI